MDAPDWSWGWVVKYSSPRVGWSREWSHPYPSEARAREHIDIVREFRPDDTAELTYAPDLSTDEVYPALVAALGGEVAPQVVRIQDNEKSAEVFVDPAELVRRCYVRDDIYDDSDYPHTTRTVQPRRLGLIYLINRLEDELHACGTVADIVAK